MCPPAVEISVRSPAQPNSPAQTSSWFTQPALTARQLVSGHTQHAASEALVCQAASVLGSSTAAISCGCVKSRCLKRYCACFQSKSVCSKQCLCCDCDNHQWSGAPQESIRPHKLARRPALGIMSRGNVPFVHADSPVSEQIPKVRDLLCIQTASQLVRDV